MYCDAAIPCNLIILLQADGLRKEEAIELKVGL
jgi:hypothetical protein